MHIRILKRFTSMLILALLTMAVLLPAVSAGALPTRNSKTDFAAIDASIEAQMRDARIPGLALGILTADCTPILFADAQAGVIGAAHAGWKGAMGGIAEATVAAMVDLGARPERIVAAIGPTISLQNYEVGPQFAADLLRDHRDAENRIARPAGGREHFDLPGFVFDHLMAAGVGVVDDLGLCTYAEPKKYFSHRYATHHQTTAGRQLSVIGLSGT